MMWWIIVSIIMAGNFVDGRKLSWKRNNDCPPDICPTTSSPVNLLHVQSEGDADILHFIITSGKGLGLPTVLLLRTVHNSTLNFNWAELASSTKGGAVTVNGSYNFASSLTFMQLIAFNDVDDTGHLPPLNSSNSILAVNFDAMEWEDPILPSTSEGSEEFFFTLRSNGSSEQNFTGNLELRISVGDTDVRATDLPRLLYTGNNSMINILARNMSTPWKNTRLAVQMLFATERPHQTDDSFTMTEVFSVDDEYTPGIFKVNIMQLKPLGASLQDSMFLQWKQVCYTSDSFSIRDSTQTSVDGKEFVVQANDTRVRVWENSVAYAWWNEGLLDSDLTTAWAVNFTFGQPEDKFYGKNSFIYWTLSYGVGDYSKDSVSLLVVMVILFGFGLPVVLIVVGTAFVFVCRYKKRRDLATSVYEPINT